jgi:hypothetical protein
MLTKDQAAKFKEEQVQEFQPKSMTGLSVRQMTVYYNILNIYGDRMKRSPGTTISLIGASPERGSAYGKERAETIKRYLVDVFGIDSSRITTEGRDKPLVPSETPGGTKDLDRLEAGDRRVDIESNSPELMIQVGGESHYMPKPVQIVEDVEDPLAMLFSMWPGQRKCSHRGRWNSQMTKERFSVTDRPHETKKTFREIPSWVIVPMASTRS